MSVVGALWDWTPWWVLLALGVAVALLTSHIWLPLYFSSPRWVKVILWLCGVGVFAYLAGRNHGAAGALQRERSRNEHARQELIEDARVARERQRLRDAGGVRDDERDPFRRD